MIKIKNKYKDAAISNSYHHETVGNIHHVKMIVFKQLFKGVGDTKAEAEDNMDSAITSYINDEDVMMRESKQSDMLLFKLMVLEHLYVNIGNSAYTEMANLRRLEIHSRVFNPGNTGINSISDRKMREKKLTCEALEFEKRAAEFLRPSKRFVSMAFNKKHKNNSISDAKEQSVDYFNEAMRLFFDTDFGAGVNVFPAISVIDKSGNENLIVSDL